MTSLSPLRALFGAALSLVSVWAAGQAAAQDLSFGLTTDLNSGNVGGVVEFHGAPVFETAHGLSGSWAIAARADTDRNAWVGAGFALDLALNDQAFVEGSFMPGYYRPGDTDLGHHLQFRSLIGFGWNVAPNGAVILSLDHISNAGIDFRNPGAETVALRYRMSF
jgi:lipid A 3-O-deacylase